MSSRNHEYCWRECDDGRCFAAYYPREALYGRESRTLHVYDTPGRADFAHGIRSYYRGMHGVMIVVDLTSDESFQGAERWLAEVDKHAGLEQGAREARCASTAH